MRTADSDQAKPGQSLPGTIIALETPGSRESLVSPERLADFFAPRSIAVVGASDTSGWARFVAASAAATGFTGPLVPVHPVHRTVFGKPAVPSLRHLPEPVDLAFVMVPAHAVEDVLDDAAIAGVRGAIVLASGYREVGDEGRVLEQRLVARAAEHGITLLGPNCLGFLNARCGAGPYALTVPLPLLAGPVGIALQSGALASVVLSFARARAIGISTLVTMGNEAMVTAPEVIEYLIADEGTRVICLFLEQITHPASFARVAEQASQAGKPMVVLKAGSSPEGSQAALAHTGAIAGDDAVVDAVLRQLNVIRVTSIEELLSTGALLGYGRWPHGRRMGVLTSSGGACDIIADRASAHGIEIPPFAPDTAAAIASHLPSFASARNPLDVTGYVLANQRTSVLTAIDHALDAAVNDPGLDFVLFSGVTLPDARPADENAARLLEERISWLGQRIATAPIPVIPVGSTCVDVTSYGRDLLGRNNIHLLGGMELGISSIARALHWLDARALAGSPSVTSSGTTGPATPSDGAAGSRTDGRSGTVRSVPCTRPDHDGVWQEQDARELLTSFGVPVVPAELVSSAGAAVAAARKIGFPVAARIASTGIAHKSDIGAVALGLSSAAQVRAGYQRVRAAGAAATTDAIDGVMVSAMRTGGVELLAGVSVDPAFGPVLAVGLGGIWVEILGDVSLRLLPVEVGEVLRMLGELKAAPLLNGARGSRPADLDALATVITRIGEAARWLGDSLRSLEVNPLWVDGDQIEALDVLVVTSSPGADQLQTEHQAARERNHRP